MEDRRMNEKESLELISEMIRKTKREASVKQDYDAFLFYGYAAVIVSAVAWALVHFTGKAEYMLVWFAMFLPYLWMLFAGKGRKPGVTTYLEGMIGSIWNVIGSMFGLTAIALMVIGLGLGRLDFSLMMPLSLIYAGIGTSVTGLVIKENSFVWPPLAGLLAAVYMLMGQGSENSWNLLFGLSFLFFMVVPAHVVRNKIK